MCTTGLQHSFCVSLKSPIYTYNTEEVVGYIQCIVSDEADGVSSLEVKQSMTNNLKLMKSLSGVIK